MKSKPTNKMEALLEYVKTASLPLNDRPNVSSTAVKSLTLGMVNKRADGYGLSAATTVDKLRLLQLLICVANDSEISGNGPECFTSICLNVDFASEVHTDSHNSGSSWIVAGGEYTGGGLFVEKVCAHTDDDREEPCSMEHAGSRFDGVSVDIKNSWYKFEGSNRHCALPYSGYRVSVVFFSVSVGKCSVSDLARLETLGFKIPISWRASPLNIPLPWPYHVFICTTRRSTSIAKDTLSTLLQDRSVPASSVTLCVRDREDAGLYCHLGLRLVVADEAATSGLPEQRKICAQYLPHGTWCLFMDDDVCRIHAPQHLDVHHLIMMGFLTAQQKHVHLWGLNTSADQRNLSDRISGAVGLVNGYLFGVITHPALRSCTQISDVVGGAAEDVERSLRYFSHSGIVRLNFATAVAKNRSNAGGLQSYYAEPERRKAAHAYVVQSLMAEFPDLLLADPLAPNGCRFRRWAIPREPEPEEGASTDSGEQEEETFLLRMKEATLLPATAPKPQKRLMGRIVCPQCGKSYARSSDLKHHVRITHGNEPPPSVSCPVCSRPFRKQKDLLVHQRSGRCWSRRGRPHEDITAPAPSSSAGEQSPASGPARECCGVPASGLETSD